MIEDTDVTRGEIDSKFGPEIGALVDGLTKIKKLDLVSKKAEQAENFRKLLVAISSDIRVLLIKLADRLHNMRTLEHMKPQSRARVSEETLEIYAPLAGRMGMQGMREELEDLAFRWSNPDAYHSVVAKLADIRKRNAGLVQEIATALQKGLSDAGLACERLRAREEAVLDLAQDGKPPDFAGSRLSDIYAFRIVVSTVDDCYRALGIAHSTWRAVPRPLQGLHFDAEPEQLPVDPHHHRWSPPPMGGAADPHGGDTRSRSSAWPRIRSTRTA